MFRNAKVCRDAATNKSKNYGFISFTNKPVSFIVLYFPIVSKFSLGVPSQKLLGSDQIWSYLVGFSWIWSDSVGVAPGRGPSRGDYPGNHGF